MYWFQQLLKEFKMIQKMRLKNLTSDDEKNTWTLKSLSFSTTSGTPQERKQLSQKQKQQLTLFYYTFIQQPKVELLKHQSSFNISMGSHKTESNPELQLTRGLLRGCTGLSGVPHGERRKPESQKVYAENSVVYFCAEEG